MFGINFFKIGKKSKSKAPKTFDDAAANITLNKTNIIELCNNVWKIEQRINKIQANDHESEITKKSMTSSVEKIKKMLESCDVTYQDYSGKQFIEGMNVDIIAVERSGNAEKSLIKETIEPEISIANKMMKKSKIILLTAEEQADGK